MQGLVFLGLEYIFLKFDNYFLNFFQKLVTQIFEKLFLVYKRIYKKVGYQKHQFKYIKEYNWLKHSNTMRPSNITG